MLGNQTWRVHVQIMSLEMQFTVWQEITHTCTYRSSPCLYDRPWRLKWHWEEHWIEPVGREELISYYMYMLHWKTFRWCQKKGHLILCPLYMCRPEADDVHALQQQLSSLHLVMEQSSSEHEKQLLQVSEEKKQLDREKEMLSQQLESLRGEVKGLPKKEDLTK